MADQDVCQQLTGELLARWGVASSIGCSLRSWDGEAVVYLEATGETHRLRQPAFAVWRVMLDQTGLFQSSPVWLQTIFPDGETAPDESADDLEAFERLLHELERVGLITRLFS